MKKSLIGFLFLVSILAMAQGCGKKTGSSSISGDDACEKMLGDWDLIFRDGSEIYLVLRKDGGIYVLEQIGNNFANSFANSLVNPINQAGNCTGGIIESSQGNISYIESKDEIIMPHGTETKTLVRRVTGRPY